MIEPIYASEEHKNIIETYITMCTEFAKDVSSKSRYNNYYINVTYQTLCVFYLCLIIHQYL